jgi:hypothetical protein
LCKEMAEVVGKYFLRVDAGVGAEGFHLAPEIAAVGESDLVRKTNPVVM